MSRVNAAYEPGRSARRALVDALAAIDRQDADEAHRLVLQAFTGMSDLVPRAVSLSVWRNDDGRVALCFDDHWAPVADHGGPDRFRHVEPPVSTDGAACACGWVHMGTVHLLAGPSLFMDKPSVAQRSPNLLTRTMVVWR